MNPKILKIIIAGMAICVVFLSYKFNEVNNDLKKYKEYYKDLSIMYLNEVIEAPKLEAPSAEDMKVTTIDFGSNMLQFSNHCPYRWCFQRYQFDRFSGRYGCADR